MQEESKFKKEVGALVRNLIYAIIAWILTTSMATYLSEKDETSNKIIVRNGCNVELPASYSIPIDTPIKVLKIEGDWYQVQFKYNQEETSGWIAKSDIEEK